MASLADFEFTPDHQPDADKPITVTLRHLDTEAKWDIERTLENGSPSWKAIEKSMRFIVTWSGSDEPFSRDALKDRLKDPPIAWRMFFASIAGHLWQKALLQESDAKKF